MTEEIHELHEHAHEGHENPSLAPVTVTMAVLAVLVAAASLLGHRAHTEELLNQSLASDKWAQYQAKSIRRHGYEQVIDLLEVLEPANKESAQKTREKYAKEAEKAQDDQKEIMEKAKDDEKERDVSRRKADRFDLGEVLLESALVITSLTVLTGKKSFWTLGGIVAGVGLIISLSGAFIQ